VTRLTNPIKPDRSKIDVKNGKQVRAWTKKLNVSLTDLEKVVEAVGNSAAEVKKELGRVKLGSLSKQSEDRRRQHGSTERAAAILQSRGAARDAKASKLSDQLASD
jgi:Protein of unknown function (DUF3606)